MYVLEVVTFDSERYCVARLVVPAGCERIDCHRRRSAAADAEVDGVFDAYGCQKVCVEVDFVRIEGRLNDEFLAGGVCFTEDLVNIYFGSVMDGSVFSVKRGRDPVWQSVRDFVFIGSGLNGGAIICNKNNKMPP